VAYFTGDPPAGTDGDMPDDVSLAPTDASTSGGTLMTRYTKRSTGTLDTSATRKTSRNRRREERKKARGKKGSVYEEEYLVNSLRRLIERINSVNADVGRLIYGLMRRGMREQANVIQSAMCEMVDLCSDVVPDVFAPSQSEATAAGSSGYVVNGDGTSPSPNNQTSQMPTVHSFERLSLFP
jgi:elongator complex protein 1